MTSEARLTIGSVFSAVDGAGLAPRGAFHLGDGERTGPLAEVRTIALVGVAGRRGWDAFAGGPEAGDGGDDPLDRFSRRVVGGLAEALGAVALYPFGGPPYWPFQQWAQRAEPVHSSPLGLLIHPEYGLWHSFRGALGFFDAMEVPPREQQPSPCAACGEKPCLASCPVSAFTPAGYDVPACADGLRKRGGADCMERGCRARRACPVGCEHAHEAPQASFAMRAFLRARGA